MQLIHSRFEFRALRRLGFPAVAAGIALAGCICLVVMFASTFSLAAETPATQPSKKLRIVLVGDSTVNDQGGWGPGLKACLDPGVECINLALNGRSSKSFRAEGAWKKCLDLKPDYVLIQFGHNDEPGKGADRETDPQTTYRQLMNQYVDEARAIGAKPVLVTSLSRRQWGTDDKIHSSLVPYVEVVKDIARQKQIPLLDLHQLSIAYYEKVGRSECETFSPRKDGKVDGTHLNHKGSMLIGNMVAAALPEVVPALKPLLRGVATTQP